MGSGAGPVFLSFGVNVGQLTEDESVVFTAVLTDPNGIDDLIGGTLTSPDGTIQYGAFATSGQEGSYSLALTWAQISQTQTLEFVDEESREFLAAFFDVAGSKTTRTVSVRFYCPVGGACGGLCKDFQNDPEHCGGCGLSADGCSQGAPYSWTCFANQQEPITCNEACQSRGSTCSNACTFGGSKNKGQLYDITETCSGPAFVESCEHILNTYFYDDTSCCCKD
ncbi:MAG: hypothetical protein AB7P03_03415 [Kofleriaceae bacterium]